MAERLQKLLSQRGIASRRRAEKLILGGRVTVNGEIAELGQRADVSHDRICVDGVEIGEPPRCAYFLVHKPKGVVSTCHDPQGRKTVLDLLDTASHQGVGIHPVGRLDADSTGALLLTNDGDFTYLLTHPRHQMSKVYRVSVKGVPSPDTLSQWQAGVVLDGRKTLPAEVSLLKRQSGDSQGDGTERALLQIALKEGRNRQIRRVAQMLGHPVTALHRSKIGSLPLGDLARGRYRSLTEKEIARLKQEAAIDPS
ncbi:pseudouridine synthase [cf. Phormidesmis sp. LEGE 11477]|uniref:pseudouridine synthase n=1 Tax=cf. Phormidesmis sp. LEGE 11477 TaxID=1828680 RepID=UPI0018808EC9|nr:pseudouridine synthase [cf. Phormidesmis sp. LEGE 11477]MBE9062357.1 rRNA pseudouridine synthase [cf. Phormidesmis sp. LEGE 11477]